MRVEFHPASPVAPVAAWMLARADGRHAARVPLIGLSAAQGAGKSTLCEVLKHDLAMRGRRLAVLALDDFYLSRAERLALARSVHPLLATRGVPGTHDLRLLTHTLDVLQGAGRETLIAWPRFDKASDDRAARSLAQVYHGRPDLIVLEGWCVGIGSEPAARLATPVNALERDADRDGRWRRYVNERIATEYEPLWRRLDGLVALLAPSFSVVANWRAEQERSSAEREGAGRLHDEAAVARFIAHYERLTRWGIESLPARADLTLWLDGQRRVVRSVARDAGLTTGAGR